MAKDVPRTEENDDLNPRPAKRAKLTPPPSSPLSSCPPSQTTSSQQPPVVYEDQTSTTTIDPTGEFSKLSPSQLLLSLPRILLHPPSHPLHARSLHISLLAFRRALSLPVLSPEEECRAWTGLAETGLRVVGGGFCDSGVKSNNDEHEWAKGVEMEVEKAIGKGLLISQNHPSLRSYRHHLTILSAQLSIWQHSFKYAKSQLRRLVQTFLPSDPRSTVYGAWLELISTLATPHASPSSQAASAPRNDDTPTKSYSSVDSRKQDVYAALSAVASLRALAKGNDHEDICLLADVIRLRIIFERESDQGSADEEGESELSRSLSACEQGLGITFEVDAGPQSKPSSSTTTVPQSPSKEITMSTPLITSLRLQTLTLGILHHTQKGLASAAGARLVKLHALCDAGALDHTIPPSSASDSTPFDPRDGEGRVEVILSGKAGTNAERMWVSVPHPRCMLLLSYLVSATSKRDAVGRKPKRKMYASEGLNIAAKEDEAEILLPSWSSIADVSLVSTTTAHIHADLLSEVIGISILRSDFSTALSSLDKLIAFTRNHRLWDAYAPLVTLHHAHVAHALGKVDRAGECYRVAAHLAGDQRRGDGEVVAGSYVRAAARAGEAALRIGLARRECEDVNVLPVNPTDNDVREEEGEMALALDAKTKALGAAVVKESRRMGGTLEAVGKVIESCLSTEILKSKECLRDALALASNGQDNYMRALILALIGVHYLHTAGEHAHDVLETCEQLVAGLGAAGDSKRKAGDPDRDKAPKEKDRKGETDAVGNAPLRLWIGERFLEMYKRKGKDKKAQAQAAANKGYQLAVEKLSDI